MNNRRCDSQSAVDYIRRQVQVGNCSVGGDRIKLDCPTCGDTKKHFYLYLSNFTAHCFRCGVHFSLREILTVSDLKFFKSKNTRGTIKIRKSSALSSGWDAVPVCPVRDYDPGVDSVVHQVYWCCVNRGVTAQQIEQYAVSVRPWVPRIYFPVWDDHGNLIYWCSRTLLDEEPRMDSMMGSNRPLYGRHVQQLTDQVILVEGVFDHFVTDRSYAILGPSVTEFQAATLRRDGVRRVFVVGDLDARAESRRSVRVLASQRIKAYSVHLSPSNQSSNPNKKDPSDYGRAVMSGVVAQLVGMGPLRPQVLVLEIPHPPTATGRYSPSTSLQGRNLW
jgi:hypothetical protein